MTEFNIKSFREAIVSTQPVVVDFWAGWCMPCKIFAPVIEELCDEMDGKADFGKVNIDECMELAQEYNIASIPTLVVYKDGVEKERMIGVHPKENLRKMVEKYI